MTIIDNMINDFRKAENYALESRTEMAEHSEEERARFKRLAKIYKLKGVEVWNYLVEEIGIDEEYLSELLTGEGI